MQRMSIARGIGKYVVTALAILIVIIGVVIAAALMASNAPVKPIIYKSIELRNATDPVKKARLITDLDDLVAQTQNDAVINQWSRMTDCLGTACPDEAYLDLVLITVAEYEEEIPESPLLINAIAVSKYLNDGDHLLEFSKALSLATDQVEQFKSKNIRKIWDQIVVCNGTCSAKNDLFFEFIKTVVQ